MTLPQGQERWVVVRTEQGEARAQATLKRKVAKPSAAGSKSSGISPTVLCL